MSLPVVRKSEQGRCQVHGALVVSYGIPDVLANHQAVSRAGDPCLCTGGVPNQIVVGAASVRIRQLPTAHVGAATARHGAGFASGSPNVFVGGAAVTVVGPTAAGKGACRALAAGRADGGSQQNFGNCGLECIRQICIANGNPMTEQQMLEWAQKRGATVSPKDSLSGGTTSDQQRDMLGAQGYPADVVEGMSNEEIAAAVADGRGVVAGVHANAYWTRQQDVDLHSVLVTGVERDANGNIIAVFINDTGLGNCMMRIPIDVWNQARANPDGTRRDAVVTKNPVFR